MMIVLNGKPVDVPEGVSVTSLLASRQLTPDKVAVEVNRRLVRGPAYDVALKENDEVEIVTFVGGGAV